MSAGYALLPIPHPRRLGPANLSLQLKHSIYQGLASGRTSRHVNINRDNPINPPNHRIAVMIIPAPVGTAAHADNPPRVSHLVVHLPQGRRHLVGHRPGYYHNVGVTRRCPEHEAEAVLVVSWAGDLHHLDCAAG